VNASAIFGRRWYRLPVLLHRGYIRAHPAAGQDRARETQQQVFDEYMARACGTVQRMAGRAGTAQETALKASCRSATLKKISGLADLLSTAAHAIQDGQPLMSATSSYRSDTYEPEAEKINLKADVPASDLSGCIGRIFSGSLEVGSASDGNHPGLLHDVG